MIIFTVKCTEWDLKNRIRKEYEKLGLCTKTTKFSVTGTGPSWEEKLYSISIKNPVYV